MRRLLSLVLVACTAAGCAARPPAPEPGSDPARWRGDPELYRLLSAYPLEAARRDSVRAFLDTHSLQSSEMLAEAAEDVDAPATVRVNALHLLAERRAALQLPVFRVALDDEDPRVRATATAAMREFLDSNPEDALRFARAALEDPHPTVQAQALQILGEREPDVLRAYLRRATDAELRAVARDLLYVAEERGAPLPADSATGAVQRDTPHGIRIAFNPRRWWPQWQAGVGDVVLSRGAATLATLGDIEAVAGVLPVFLSQDGGHVVFERARRIVVRDLASGTERVVGAGVAPRPRPFTGDFVFLREETDARTEMRQQTRLRYEVVRAPFDGSAPPEVLGTTTATVSFDQHGSYSPVRWMRVEERGGAFFLGGVGMELFALPDPFRPPPPGP